MPPTRSVTYWVTVGERLFRGAALDDLEAAAAQALTVPIRLRGVWLNDADDRLYVADESGQIHHSEDGLSWRFGADRTSRG